MQKSFIVLFLDSLIRWHKLLMDHFMCIKESNQDDFHFRLLEFFLSWKILWPPFGTLSFCFGIVLVTPLFVVLHDRLQKKKDLSQLWWLSPHNFLFCIASDRLSKNAARITNKSISFPNYPSKSCAPSFCPHCKNFPKRYAWLSVTFLGFISFEQVAGNNRIWPWNVPDFRNLVDLSE